MSTTINFGVSIQNPLVNLSYNEDASADGFQKIGPLTISGATSDFQVDLEFDTADLILFYLKSDLDIGVYTNDTSAGTPADTFNVIGGRDLFWTSSMYFSNIFGTDVTTIYINNLNADDATVEIIVLSDRTP